MKGISLRCSGDHTFHHKYDALAMLLLIGRTEGRKCQDLDAPSARTSMLHSTGPRYSFPHTLALLPRGAFLRFEGRRSASEGRCGSRLNSSP